MGTGFLIGEQVVMTARHVLRIGQGCHRLRVVIGGRTYTPGNIGYWYAGGPRNVDVADLATFKLNRPSQGYVFSFAGRTPPRKSTVAVIGYPLGGPLSFIQGPLSYAGTDKRGLPILVVRMVTAPGSSGSAFLDSAGNVVGILQAGAVFAPDFRPQDGFVTGINVVRWWGSTIKKDLCREYPHGGLPFCGSPVDCGKRDAAYLGRLSGPWITWVNRWNAWIDAGNPPDESLRGTLNALYALAERSLNFESEACSAGARRVAKLFEGLFPLLDQVNGLLNDLTSSDDVARIELMSQISSLLQRLNSRLEAIEAELRALGFFDS
jgi:hypothetical protein